MRAAAGQARAAFGGPWLWVAATLAATAAVGGWLPATVREALDWQPALAWTQPWRWFTAAGVHLSPGHLALNLAGLAAVAALGAAAGCRHREAAAWLAAWPLTHGLLLGWPMLGHYAGASGVLHAGLAVACFAMLRAAQARSRIIGAWVGLGLVAKLIAERPWQSPLQSAPDGDFAVAVIAHACGAAAGLLAATVAWATDRSQAKATIER